MIRLESLILRICERRALSERDSCMRILEMHAEPMRGSICTVGTKCAQILFVIGTAVTMLVNARSSNHKPNQEADHDPKRLAERDSLLCEQALCVTDTLITNLFLKEMKTRV